MGSEGHLFPFWFRNLNCSSYIEDYTLTDLQSYPNERIQSQDIYSAGDSGTLFSEDVVTHFEKISRLVHFCLTPLLFLPKWRQVAHSTRLRSACVANAADTNSM